MRMGLILGTVIWLFVLAAIFLLFGDFHTAVRLAVFAEIGLLAAIEIDASMEETGAVR